MKTITLSGGNFGGLSIDIPDEQEEAVMVDEAGSWKYALGISNDKETAVFVEFV